MHLRRGWDKGSGEGPDPFAENVVDHPRPDGDVAKETIISRELALFGGSPTFASKRFVGRPNVGDAQAFRARMDGVLESGWFTHNGPLERELEARIAEETGAAHCVLVSNGTVGLELVVRAAGLSGEVIMPSMTFVATPHAVNYCGLRPVFCDVDPITGCIDPDEVASLITPRTSAVMGVHLWGRACAVARLQEVADRHGLALLLDSAQALGTRVEGRAVGSSGTAEVFSLHTTKVVNSFEGGAVTTDDADLADAVRRLHNFGIGVDGNVGGPGTNAKMTEAAAAMGLTSLEALGASIARNRARHASYRAVLENVPGIRLIEDPPGQHSNHQYVVITVDPAVTDLHRDALLDLLRAENVYARPYFSPGCHRLEPYRTEAPVTLPRTDTLADRVLALPTGPSVSDEDATVIAELISEAMEHGAWVAERWERLVGPDRPWSYSQPQPRPTFA